MASTFRSVFPACMMQCTNYMRWRREIDETPGLEFLRLSLQVLELQGYCQHQSSSMEASAHVEQLLSISFLNPVDDIREMLLVYVCCPFTTIPFPLFRVCTS